MSWGQLCNDPSLFSMKLRIDMICEEKKEENKWILIVYLFKNDD